MKKIASMLAVLLAACGGGGGSDVYPSMQVQSAQEKTISVLTTGDSTTTPVYDDEKSVPGILADVTGWHVQNIGRSGTSVCMVDIDVVKATHANVVTANFAINDSALEDIKHDRDCWVKLASSVHDAGAELVIVESNPIVPGGQWSYTRDDAKRKEFEVMKRQFATDVGAYYCGLPSKTWALDDLPDGVHPGQNVKPLIAARYAECIKAALN